MDAKLRTVLQRLVKRGAVQHASLALASGDGTRQWAAAAGPADESGTAMRPQTPFFIASVTKRFTAVLLLQAAERQEVDLGAPLTQYLPAETTQGLHNYRGKDYSSQITLGHLATHTSGLPDHFEKRQGAKHQKARYSDTGFQLLIRVLETVTAQSYADLLQQRITGPLGLQNTQRPGTLPSAQLSRKGSGSESRS